MRRRVHVVGGLAGGRRLDSAEDHPPRAGLQDAGDRQADDLAKVIGALFGDDHGPIVQVADSLTLFLARA